MSNKKRVTIRDIAEKARVSPSTVSLVLSQKEGVSEYTKEKVIRIAKELGYKIKGGLRKLDSISSNTILLLAFIDGTHSYTKFYSPLIEGITTTLRNRGFKVMIDICGEKDSYREDYIKLHTKDIAGVIIFSSWQLEIKELIPLLEERKPFVILDTNVIGLDKNSVEINHYEGAIKAVEYLINCGHTKIAHITGSIKHPHSKLRVKGYIDTMNKYNLRIYEGYIRNGDFNDMDIVRKEVEELIKINPLPTAIFASSDNIALTTMKTLRDYNFRIPEDISLIGFDDTYAASSSNPLLTTIRQPLVKLGIEGAEMIISLLESGKLFTDSKTISPELVIRESVIAVDTGGTKGGE